MKKLTPDQIRKLTNLNIDEMTKGMATPRGIPEYRSDSMSAPQRLRRLGGLATMQRNMAPASLMEALAQPVGIVGGLWTVPLFERFPHLLEPLSDGMQTEAVILMIDLSGFSVATDALDPAGIREILDPFYTKTVETIEGRGGVVEKFIGDAVIAVFGYPFRPTNDANQPTNVEDLATAWFAAQEVIEWVHQHYPKRVRAKAAISAGEVFLGWVGPDQYSDLTVIGQPMTVLFRLENVADPNEVLIPQDLCRPLSDVLGLTNRRADNWWADADVVDLRGVSGKTSICRIQYRPR